MNFSDAWSDLRRRRRLSWGSFASGLPVAALAAATHSRIAFVLGAATWLLGTTVASWRHANFGCPRCAKSYFKVKGYGNPFAPKCMHCGLQRDTCPTVEEVEWWLCRPLLPEMSWARLRRFSDGAADVLDCHGRQDCFASVERARSRLMEDDFAALTSLGPDLERLGVSRESRTPPVGVLAHS